MMQSGQGMALSNQQQQQQQQHYLQQQAWMMQQQQQQPQSTTWNQQPPQQQQYQVGSQPATTDEIRTLWIGDLQYWMDENYIFTCFAPIGEVVAVKLIRNKQTGQLEGYGFIDFMTRAGAEKALLTYNGKLMPNVEQNFRLNWASFGSGEKRGDDTPDYTIFVGDLAPDVTDYILQETFKPHYTSIKGAKVVIDRMTGRAKGFGFVKFGDEGEQQRAMTEMNGMYCSSRPMRIGVAANRQATNGQQQYPKASYQSNEGSQEHDPNNTTVFVGGLDSNVTDEHLRQVFSQYGELIHVKIPVGKRCAFVQYAIRSCAEEAIRVLNGTVVGGQSIRLSWGRTPNKQDPSVVAVQQQPEANQWNSTGGYFGYAAPPNYETYGYGQPGQNPNAAFYGNYPGYTNYQQQPPQQ